MANSYGKIFRLTTFGESHGKAIGGIIDGCPAGFTLNFEDILYDLVKVFKHFNKDKAHIVGLSMGGQIATLFYEKYPRYPLRINF